MPCAVKSLSHQDCLCRSPLQSVERDGASLGSSSHTRRVDFTLERLVSERKSSDSASSPDASFGQLKSFGMNVGIRILLTIGEL